MTRGVLIAGNESSLFFAAAREAAKRVESFATVVIPNRFSLPTGDAAQPEKKSETESKNIALSWNPAHAISARTLVLAAENRMEQIDDAVLICSPPAVFKTIENLLPEDIELLVNDHIKGWFFLVRELSLYFHKRGKGTLSLVTPEIAVVKSTPQDLLGPSAQSSFRAFASAVLATYASEPFQVMGFTTAELGSDQDFAAWFFKMIDAPLPKNSGRWHKYSKLKFFR
jgi:NAD(P)-dependent dehydrogenase (short-subunit alcohol dehydrogenase family)